MLFLCYIIAYVDRNNVSIAFDTMKQDLNKSWLARQGGDAPVDAQGQTVFPWDGAVLGTGFGIFFIGYFLLEIPGTLLVEKWSARKWISRIMITWGIVAALTAFVKTPGSSTAVRFLLGLAEAGFFPGVIVYLTHWFPSRDRARALAWFFDRHADRPDHQPEALEPPAEDRHRRGDQRRDVHHPEVWAWRAGSGSTSPGASRRWSWGSWSWSS